jgi:hypothetical protein
MLCDMRLRAVATVLLFVGCRASEVAPTSPDPWQYPVRLGDPRSVVHRVLTAPTRDNGILEEYPSSGVTVLFDAEGRVARISLLGPASNIYSLGNQTLPSSRFVLFGLTGETTESGFRRILGVPATASIAGAAVRRELRCTWKKAGYIITAEFLAAPRDRAAGKTYPPGTLLWFEVSRGI